ncbi:hypothetical protein Taro_009075 [Colocasia esculenta]|uniref:Uncharacterized protein n=1 Tax=Colocasia esculenta TaxID=4460 RepID=A0A843U3S9_COLES|nr:hypothetical protein [Colocasia esculenta]
MFEDRVKDQKTPTVVTSPVGCPRFSVSQAVARGFVPFTAFAFVFGCSVLGEFPTEPVTSEAHPYSPQVRARRRFLYRRPVRSRVVAVLAQRLQQCSFSFFSCTCCTSGLRPVRGRRTRVKYVIGLTGLNGAFRHSWYQSKVVVMADRRDWGGGGDDPEESTQRMIERIWESLTDIRARMDQQAPVPPVTREEVPVAPVPPQPGVDVPFVAPLAM